MKRAFVLLLITLSTTLYSQGQGCLFDRSVDTLGYVVPHAAATFGNKFLMGNGIGGFMHAGMFEVDCFGQRVWYNIPVIPGQITDIAYANDRIFAAGVFDDYSDVEPGFGAFVLVYDTNRNLLDWHAYIRDSLSYYNDSTITGHYTVNQTWAADLPSNNPEYRQVQLSIVDTTHILLSAWNNIVGVNLTDWSITWAKRYDGYVNDISPQINNRFYVVTRNKLYWVDTFGDSLRVNTGFYDGRQVYHADNGRDYVTANGSVIEIDTSLNTLHQYPLSVDFANFNGLTGYGNTVFLTGSYNIANNLIAELVFDSSLQLDTSFAVEKTCSLPVAATANDSVVLLTGGKGTNFYKTYSQIGDHEVRHGNMQFGPIAFDSVSYVAFDTVTSGSQTYIVYHLYIRYRFALTNIGSDTIHDFSLRDEYRSLPVNGFGPLWYNYYSGLSIAPNDSIVVNDYYFNDFYHYVPSQYDSILTVLYVSSINGVVPDTFCGSISSPVIAYNIPTGISENLQQKVANVYPNPTNSQITIQLSSIPTPNTTFTLTDLSGRQLLRQTLVNSNNQVDMSQLAAGVYVYTIKNGQQVPVIGKVVKE